MSAELGKGVQVRCIDAGPHGTTGETLLVVGRVYTIRDLFWVELILEEMPDHSWRPTRFEPLGRRSFDHFLLIGDPADDLVPA